MSTDKFEIFCCYASEDAQLLHELEAHLRPFIHTHHVTLWADKDIQAGMEREKEIRRHLDTAQIILLLISPAFIASDYCFNSEMPRAMERHEQGKAEVIPIILRPTYWKDTPIAHLQTLPNGGIPITRWQNSDAAFHDVAASIAKSVEMLSQPEPSSNVASKVSTRYSPGQLQRERKRRGWSQKYLADLLQIDPKVIGRWERGMNLPNAYYRQKLSLIFEKSSEELGLFPNPRKTSEESELHTSYDPMVVGGVSQPNQLASVPTPLHTLPRLTIALLRSLARRGKRSILILGKLSLVLNLNKAALSIYERAITHEPQNPDLYIAKGKALLGLKRRNEALTAYQQAIHLAPDSSAAYKGEGRTFEQLAQQIFDETMQQAHQSYEKAKQLGIE